MYSLTEMEHLNHLSRMREEGETREDMLVYMIQNKVARVMFVDGEIYDPAERVLH